MKNVLVILDGHIAKHLMKRMCDLNNNFNQYDIVYNDDSILLENLPSNFTLYKFDPTSYSKLQFVLNNALYQDALVLLNTKEETKSVIKNIRSKYKELFITVYDNWDLQFHDKNIQYYRGNDILSNGLVEQLPNIPVFAQNIGLRQGEIMEVKIPFGSTYAYRYIGSIGQKDWKIVALYRDQELFSVKPSLILKPNDIIILVGKPDVLTQVYSAMSKISTQFPMPFGKNLYLYLDLYIQSKNEVVNAIKSVKILHQRMKSSSLIVKITRPTTVDLMNDIYALLENTEKLTIDIDYHHIGINHMIKTDMIKFDIGMIVLTKSIFEYKETIKKIISLKLPIFKLGYEHISSLKNSLLLLNDDKLYEQISPILFDISSQLKISPKILNIDPIGDKSRQNIIAHLNNLSKIFTQNITIVTEESNPIKRLHKEQNCLQILPLKIDMFEKRTFKFLSTDSDLLSFDINKFNQLLIPVIDDLN